MVVQELASAYRADEIILIGDRNGGSEGAICDDTKC
jgi:hypothetical protein